MIYGGRANWDGVTLYGRRFAVRARHRADGELVYQVMNGRDYLRRLRRLIGGLIVGVLLVLLLLPQADLLPTRAESYWLALGEKLGIWLALAAAQFIACQFTPLGRYHAAEHMVINAVARGQSSLEQVEKAERFCWSCGTAYIGLTMYLLLPLAFLPLSADEFLVAFAAVLLLVLLLDRRLQLRRRPLARRIGQYWQLYLTTSPPRPEHVRVAHACAEKLLSLERGSSPRCRVE